jgi:hypothetical protein
MSLYLPPPTPNSPPSLTKSDVLGLPLYCTVDRGPERCVAVGRDSHTRFFAPLVFLSSFENDTLDNYRFFNPDFNIISERYKQHFFTVRKKNFVGKWPKMPMMN